MRLRLLKVVAQPIFVMDDGQDLTEKPGEVLHLSPTELSGFPDRLFAQIEEHNAVPVGPPAV